MAKQYGYWLQGYYKEPLVNFVTGKATIGKTQVCIAFETMGELERWANKYNVLDRKIEPCYFQEKGVENAYT